MPFGKPDTNKLSNENCSKEAFDVISGSNCVLLRMNSGLRNSAVVKKSYLFLTLCDISEYKFHLVPLGAEKRFAELEGLLLGFSTRREVFWKEKIGLILKSCVFYVLSRVRPFWRKFI